MTGVAPIDNPELVRRNLHEEIDRMAATRLVVVRHVLWQLELADTAEQLDPDFDAARAGGHLSTEKIDQAIRAARAAHPNA